MSDARMVSLSPSGNGKYRYRASALHNCTSALLASRLGLDPASPPDWMQERFDEGHRLEDPVLDRARARGMTLANFQAEMVQAVGPAEIAGHIDALGYPNDLGVVADTVDFDGDTVSFPAEVLVVDAKAFAQSTFDNWVRGIEKGDVWERFPYYAWQKSIYSKGYGDIPIAMAIGLKDRSNVDDVKIVDFRLDIFTRAPVPFGKIMARVLEIERLAAQGMDAMPAKCDYAAYPCPYWAYPFHTDADGKKADADSEFTDSDIDGGLVALAELAEKKLAASRRLKEAEAEIAAIEERIVKVARERTGSAKVARLSNTVSSVSLYHHGYSTVDWGQMARDFPGLDKGKYQKTQPSSKISVKVNPKRQTAKVNVEAMVE